MEHWVEKAGSVNEVILALSSMEGDTTNFIFINK
jgi:hypothetical protein